MMLAVVMMMEGELFVPLLKDADEGGARVPLVFPTYSSDCSPAEERALPLLLYS